MKNILLLFVAIILSTQTMLAQHIDSKVAYKYNFIVNLDKDGNAIQKLDCQGIILLAQSNGQQAISITIGDKETYTGVVYSKKEEHVGSNTKLTVYLVIQEFQGHKVPLQIFEEYDLSKSPFIPNCFTVMICNSQTGESVQGQAFYNISRIR